MDLNYNLLRNLSTWTAIKTNSPHTTLLHSGFLTTTLLSLTGPTCPSSNMIYFPSQTFSQLECEGPPDWHDNAAQTKKQKKNPRKNKNENVIVCVAGCRVWVAGIKGTEHCDKMQQIQQRKDKHASYFLIPPWWTILFKIKIITTLSETGNKSISLLHDEEDILFHPRPALFISFLDNSDWCRCLENALL